MTQLTDRQAMSRYCDTTEARVKELEAENTRLRAALANSKDACVYCQLPAEDMAKCKAGFPGCARADDMTGCPEFGASMEAHELRERLRPFAEAWHTGERVHAVAWARAAALVPKREGD